MPFQTPPSKRVRSSLASSSPDPSSRRVPADHPPPRLRLDQVVSRAMPLGDRAIDTLLSGGIYTKRITEICGASATGKTAFCLSFCLAAQSSDSRPIYLVNSESSVIIKRLHTLRARYPGSSLDQVQAFQRPINTIEAFMNLVMSKQFERLFEKGAAAVILDTLPRLSVEQVIQVMDHLRSLAIAHDTAVIVTNGMVGIPETDHKADAQNWSQVRPHVTGTQPGPGWADEPRMGWTLTRNVDTRILLTRRDDLRTMKVLYSADTNCGSLNYKLKDIGLVGV